MQPLTSLRLPLVVEFIGVTGAGKTTLMTAVRKVLAGQGYGVCEAHEAVVGSWAGKRPAPGPGSLQVYLLALPRFLRYAATAEGRRLSSLAAQVIARDAGGLAPAARLAGNFARRIGVHLLLREAARSLRGCDFVLFDEGPVHTAHNLFVHAGASPRGAEVALFTRLVPKPDLLVWVRAPQAQSVDCTLRRGHARVNGTAADAQAFIAHAHIVFDTLGQAAPFRDRLLVVDNSLPGPGEDKSSVQERAQAIGRFLARYRPRDGPASMTGEGPVGS